MTIINLSRPTRSERVRDFQPPWRTVFVYACSECGGETKVRASSFRGRQPVPSVGAISCPHCELLDRQWELFEKGIDHEASGDHLQDRGKRVAHPPGLSTDEVVAQRLQE